MSEEERLRELSEYYILDTPPEKELDELTELASLICNTPVSLITLLDEKRQWFKSKKGVSVDQTDRKDSFCQYALDQPNDVMVVNDTLEDERFSDSVLVVEQPNVRFYAGAPLVTPNGEVLGTLCVIDNEPRQINENQKEALKLLAKKTMDYLNARKLLEQQKRELERKSVKLRKLTNQAPVMICEFERSSDGKVHFNFVSEGIRILHPTLDPESVMEDPTLAFSHCHPEDLPIILESIERSFNSMKEWAAEFRVIKEDGKIEWHSGRAKPERQENGHVIWYGTVMNVTNRVAYENSLEQIAFDISHVLRRPVTTLLGLASVIEHEEMTKKKFHEYCAHIKSVSEELETFTSKLNETYCRKRDIITGNDIS